MRRSHSVHETSVGLFAFLDVLMSTMGSLILVLMIVSPKIHQEKIAKAATEATRDIVKVEPAPAPTPAPKPVPIVAPPRPTIDLNAKFQARVAELASHIDDKRRAADEAEHALATERDKSQQIHANREQLEHELAQLRAAKDRTLASVDELSAEGIKVESELAKRGSRLRKIRDHIAHESTEYAFVAYDGVSGTTRRPILIECANEKMKFLQEGITLTPADVAGFTASANPLLAGAQALVEYWATHSAPNDPKPYVLLVVRPSGTLDYYRTRNLLGRMRAPYGYELLPEDQKLAVPPPDPQAVAACRQAIDKAIALRNKVFDEVYANNNSLDPRKPWRSGGGGGGRSELPGGNVPGVGPNGSPGKPGTPKDDPFDFSSDGAKGNGKGSGGDALVASGNGSGSGSGTQDGNGTPGSNGTQRSGDTPGGGDTAGGAGSSGSGANGDGTLLGGTGTGAIAGAGGVRGGAGGAGAAGGTGLVAGGGGLGRGGLGSGAPGQGGGGPGGAVPGGIGQGGLGPGGLGPDGPGTGAAGFAGPTGSQSMAATSGAPGGANSPTPNSGTGNSNSGPDRNTSGGGNPVDSLDRSAPGDSSGPGGPMPASAARGESGIELLPPQASAGRGLDGSPLASPMSGPLAGPTEGTLPGGEAGPAGGSPPAPRGGASPFDDALGSGSPISSGGPSGQSQPGGGSSDFSSVVTPIMQSGSGSQPGSSQGFGGADAATSSGGSGQPATSMPSSSMPGQWGSAPQVAGAGAGAAGESALPGGSPGASAGSDAGGSPGSSSGQPSGADGGSGGATGGSADGSGIAGLASFNQDNYDAPSRPAGPRRWGYSSPQASIGFEHDVTVWIGARSIVVGGQPPIPINRGESSWRLAAFVLPALDREARTWGRPPDHLYWVPSVKFVVSPGGNLPFERLRPEIERHGLVSSVDYSLELESPRQTFHSWVQ